jgi:hypothetical protein
MMQVIATILHLTFLWRKRQQNTSRPVARFATLFFVLRKKTAHWGTGGVPGTQHVGHVLLVVQYIYLFITYLHDFLLLQFQFLGLNLQALSFVL